METRWLPRLVGVIIAAFAIGAAVLLWLAISGRDFVVPAPVVTGVTLWAWDLLYSRQRPPVELVWVALAVAVFAACSVATVELWAARRSARSSNARETPLSPAAHRVRLVSAGSTSTARVTVTILVPAHDEEAILPTTLQALLAQNRRPDRVIVVADNCTDGTIDVARTNGVEVFSSVGNTEKKAGALNQALATLLPDRGDNDLIMVMDADTSLAPGFIAEAVRRFEADPVLMAVGGIFYGEDVPGLLSQFQRSEYIRYSRQIIRRRGRVFVLTGTSSIFRPEGLRAIATARGTVIPGRLGDVYDTVALTEDNELTIALKSLGARLVSPSECTVVTELMPTWRALWRQRMRWQRGAVENLGEYGLTTATARYWGQQVAIGYGTIALYSFMLMMAVTILAADTWVWFSFWLAIGAVFILERVVTVWRGGIRARLLAVALVPELLYDMFLNAVFVTGLYDITLGRVARWGNVRGAAAPDVPETQR